MKKVRTPNSLMNIPSSSRLHHIGLFLVVLYLSLLAVASFCVFAHASPENTSHQHSQQSPMHSVLCTWACQVGSHSSVDQISAVFLINPILIILWVIGVLFAVSSKSYLGFLRPRGPPLSI